MTKSKFNLKLLAELCEATGVPGNEENIRKIVKRELKGHVDKIDIDHMGNLIALKKGNSSQYRTMSAAHMDEIGFMVSHIDDKGFIKFQTLGGFDAKTLTAQRVTVHGKKDLVGVMGSKPIHAIPKDQRGKGPEIEHYYVDTGLDVKDVKKLVQIGDFITRKQDLIELGDLVSTKSLDNRVSVFVLIETLKALKKPAYDFYGAFTVQEEVGLRGAKTASNRIKPDFALCLDTTLAMDTPGVSKDKQCTALGEGAAIKVFDGMTICDSRMVRYMTDIAKKAKIKSQRELLSAGGTDTSAMQLAGEGSIAGAISIPTRYIHSTVETAHKDDITACIQLLTKCAEGLDTFDFKWS